MLPGFQHMLHTASPVMRIVGPPSAPTAQAAKLDCSGCKAALQESSGAYEILIEDTHTINAKDALTRYYPFSNGFIYEKVGQAGLKGR